MDNLPVNNDQYNSLLEDCTSYITEGVFSSRWTLIKTYHLVGERIRQERPEGEIRTLVQRVAKDLGKSERTFYYAVKFYDKCPVLDKIEEVLELPGKNTSWSKVIKSLGLPQDEKIKENKDNYVAGEDIKAGDEVEIKKKTIYKINEKQVDNSPEAGLQQS